MSKNKVVYDGSFVKVQSLGEVLDLVGTIDILVFHNSKESEEEKVRLLGEIKDRVGKLIYICNEKDVDLAVKMIVIGSGGRYFDDEFFLEDTDELLNLVESLDEVTALAELGGTNVLGDFFNRYLKSGSTNFSKGYLTVVKEAVNTLMEEYNQKNLEIIRMSETATDIFANTTSLIGNMKKESAKLQSIVSRMSQRVEEKEKEIRQPQNRRAGASVLFYPRVTYMKEKSIVRVKEIGSCRYLISFILGLRCYLENIKNVRPKLIVISPLGSMYEKRYEDYSWVTQSSLRSSGNYYKNIVFTNCPNKEVLYKLLDDTNFDVFLVVDMTVTSKDHILNCKGQNVKYAVSGMSDIQRFKLPVGDCFSSITSIKGSMFTIPMYPDYPIEKGARERFYLSEFSDSFEKLLTGLRRL